MTKLLTGKPKSEAQEFFSQTYALRRVAVGLLVLLCGDIAVTLCVISAIG